MGSKEIKKPKRSNRVKVTLVGRNASEVTGSMTMVEYKDITICIDAGMYQGSSKYKDYMINKNMYKDISLKSISSIVLTHKNADHNGNVCRMFNQGGNPNVYMVEGSYRIAELMYKDSFKINTADCAYFTKKYEKEHDVLFTEEDIYKALGNTIEKKYNEKFQINKYMWVEFIPAGHIYLSAQILLSIEDGSFKRKILFTGDLGNIQQSKPVVEKFQPVEFANLVVGECTYAMTENKSTQKHKDAELELLKLQIHKTCFEKKGSILFGAFALQRSLDILIDLYSIWEKTNFSYPVYLDTPLGVAIFKIMEEQSKDELFYKLNNWDNLKFITEFKTSQSIMMSDEPKLLISSSGFAQGGRILSYFTQILPHRKNCLASIGYCSEGCNMGLVKQRKPITIMNDGKLSEYQVRCDILELNSYSSHMQSDTLLEYYASIKCDKIVLNHGDSNKKYQFAEVLSEKYSELNKTTKVYVMNQGEYIEI